MGKTLSRRLILLGLVSLLALASPGTAAIFCVAGNGHAAVEELASPCCDAGTEFFHPVTIITTSDADHRDAACGPCVDLQLTSPSHLETSSKVVIPVCTHPITADAALMMDVALAAGTRRQHGVTQPRILELLASIVLLI